MGEPFAIKDCALISIATGTRAQDIREFRDRLQTTPPACIYYHFWGGLLRPCFDEPEYQNDFAAWAWHGLRDSTLAERLALIDPTQCTCLEELRRELLDIVEERMDESEWINWVRARTQFYFTHAQIVVFDSGKRIKKPDKLGNSITKMSSGSIFYHFIDARKRTEHSKNDFSEWLSQFGDEYTPLSEHLATVDPYFTTLSDLREELGQIFSEHAPKETTGEKT
ncbi:MAG TPA: DUF5752 family protein [Desulfomicrobiaceae bacterium]|nr:DUF5752 family protein [Desulfomicrobiaceae bacterium]